MHVDIPREEYDRARAEFRKWDTGGNFLLSIRDIAVALVVSVLAYFIFRRWWILIVSGLLLLDLTRKEGIREGYIYGFEYGMERAFWKLRGGPNDDAPED